MSNPDLPMPRRFTQALAKYQQGGGNKKGWAGLREMLSEAGSPSTWLPKPNAISERSTGKTMGYHADLMAEINGIERKDQDAFAMASHAKAARAQKDGRLREEIVPVSPGKGAAPVAVDDIVRGEQDAAKVAKLPPAFRPPPKGTVTAASSSPLTDGASAVLVMEEEHARALGFPADVFVLAYVKTAIDPNPQLLLAPAVGISRALDRAGLSLSDIDVFEIHEAFAAQVLSTIKVLASPDFARKGAFAPRRRRQPSVRANRPPYTRACARSPWQGAGGGPHSARQGQPQRQLHRHWPSVRRHGELGDCASDEARAHATGAACRAGAW